MCAFMKILTMYTLCPLRAYHKQKGTLLSSDERLEASLTNSVDLDQNAPVGTV